jgi:uncharacterized protein
VVGGLSALAGIGGGALIVPFLYLVYAPSGVSPSAQTVVAHATSLGVAFVASTTGTWRYARARAIVWPAAAAYALPAVVSAFVTARVLARAGEITWLRGAFGAFLILIAADMARRARLAAQNRGGEVREGGRSWILLPLVGVVSGGLSALLGIGGGMIAVPVLLYLGHLPVKAVAPTALAGVCLTTLSGGLGYLTAGPGPLVSPWMVGFMDLRMAVPLALGAAVTVPLGVRVNRRSSVPALFWIFAGVFALIGLYLVISLARGRG